jgi:hypothetical protein
MPAKPPEANFDHELRCFGSPWPSKLASARFAASYEPNLMAVSGMILMTLSPFPSLFSIFRHIQGQYQPQFIMMQTYQQKDFEHPLSEQDLEKRRQTVLLHFSKQR